jgi:addiction module HigA family antidote
MDERAGNAGRIRTHPGEVLREEFLSPLGMSANALALRVPATRIGAIIREKEPRAITADTALRLARYFGTSAQFWLNLQSAYELSRVEADHGSDIKRDIRPRAA